jgi:tRNA G18 (ribose-2'-O)-methylase SpoU
VNEAATGMRGYFGIGVEGISKPMNVGNLFRSAHAFGASFVFTVKAHHTAFNAPSDTSRGTGHLPSFAWNEVEEVRLPEGCRLVGIELLDEAVALPSFKHPLQAAYVLGPERGSLSPALVARCDHMVKIPTRFCLNVGVAGAIVMYDRLLTLGRFGERPLHEGAEPEPRRRHVHGGIYSRRKTK